MENNDGFDIKITPSLMLDLEMKNKVDDLRVRLIESLNETF